MNDSYTLRPVSISRLKRGRGGGGGKWLQDFGDHKIFKENGGGDLSSPIEYEEGTIEN